MEFYHLTQKDLENATTYIPIMKKKEFITAAAENCIDSLSISANISAEDSTPMPAMYKENSFIKSRFLMGALLKLYFGKNDFECVGDSEYLMTADEYDRYAGGHVFDELNRLKYNHELRDKAFDILTDYKDLSLRLDREIHGLIKAMNDVVSRAMLVLTQSLQPANLQNMLNELEESKNALDDYIKGKSIAGNQEG